MVAASAVFAAIAALPAAPAAAQDTVDVEQILTETLDAHGIPGGAVTVVSGGTTATHVAGIADLEAGTPIDPERTRFPIDSVSKTFTATAVMTLVDEGVLDLDTDVNEYLDRVEVEDAYPGQPITLRHLLTHTSGFEEDIIGIFADLEGDGDGLEAALLDRLPDRVRPPGEIVAYSNHGSALAGLVAADAADVDFDDLLIDRVLEPLGMGDTDVLTGDSPASPATAATTYIVEDGEPTAYERPGEPLYPAGGLRSTAADMGRYMQFHLGDGEPLLSAASAAELHGTQFQQDPRLPGFALALYETYHGATRTLAHGGDGPGSHSFMLLVPDRDLGVYVVVNGDAADGAATAAVEEAARAVVDGLLGEAAEADGPTGAAAPGTAIEAVAGTYRSSRMNFSDYSSLFLTFGAPVTVEVAEDGALTTTGLSADPDVEEQHWVPVDTGLYQERDGTRLIAFGEYDGAPMLYQGGAAFERLPWYSDAMLRLALAAAGIVLLFSLIAWPVVALLRRLRGGRRRGGPKSAAAFAAAAGLLTAGFMAVVAYLLTDTDQFVNSVMEGVPIVPRAAVLLALAAAASVGMAVCAVVSWKRRWWSTAGRIHYSAAAFGAVVFMAIAQLYHLPTAPLMLLH